MGIQERVGRQRKNNEILLPALTVFDKCFSLGRIQVE